MCLKPFLQIGHPLKNKKITLSDWYQSGTEILFVFDLFFWVFIFIFCIFVLN